MNIDALEKATRQALRSATAGDFAARLLPRNISLSSAERRALGSTRWQIVPATAAGGAMTGTYAFDGPTAWWM